MVRSNRVIQPQPRWNKFLFGQALTYMEELGGNTIVEIGTIRDATDAGRQADGWSTYEWAESGHRVWSVDIDGIAIKMARKIVANIGRVNFVKKEGVAFLKGFVRDIDLLYLDGPNGGRFGLMALAAAQMARSSIILIDDCDLSEEKNKGALVIPAALTMGYVEVEGNGRQVLLARSGS